MSEEFDSREITYVDESAKRDDSRYYQGMSDAPERNVLYLARVGLLRLRGISEKERTKAVCLECIRLHPEDYLLVPESVRREIPESDQKLYEERAKQAAKTEKDRTDADKQREKTYRDATGDYNHDGVRDVKDKIIERRGDQYLGI